MKQLRQWIKQDISKPVFWVLVVCVFAAKALLGRLQLTYVWVGGAPLDDELMWRAAQNISAGQWLGAYDFLTLSKQMFFAVWLAFCSFVRVPYLVAGQLLACGAALAMAQAFAPVLKTNRSRFLLFAALAFSPAVSASFTLRVYRDNIFPAECMLFFAGMVGCALRYKDGLRRYWLWLVLAGAGLGTAFITREDGIWLMPFALLGTLITLGYILAEKGLHKKLLRCASLLLPYGLLAAAVLIVSGLNYKHYGIFATSDFSSGSFAAAYGAMTRVEHQADDDPLVPIPQSVRLQLYQAVPELEPLRYWLEEDESLRGSYANSSSGDYMAGSFYWALRRAAQSCGIYETAQQAQAYWQTVADKTNAAIDAGVLKAAVGPRSSTTPIIKAEHVLPTLGETFYSVFYCAAFRDCRCYYVIERSLITPEDAAVWQRYLGSGSNYAAVAGSDAPYYSPLQMLAYRCFDVVRLVYSIAVPLLLALALVWLVADAVRMCRRRTAEGLLLWLVLLGILGMALLRCAMIAFMEVAAFRIGTYVMYLSTVHPLLITFAVAGALQWKKSK